MLSAQVTLCPQSPSLSTLDLSHESNSNFPHLLADSVSLGSLWSLDASPVPAFPLGCMIPMFNVGFKSNLETLAGDRGVEGLFEHNSRPNVTTTVPTPPRLRTMLQENICVKKWAQNVAAVKPPGHRPWTTAIRAKVNAWIPEGSMHTPEAFRGALADARYRSADSDCDSPVPSCPAPARHRTSYRDALVFEREITLRTGDTTQRWSLQVPASTMKPEMVDMMLELRNLNSFFKKSVESDTVADSALPPCVEPPALIVSNSQTMMPLSLESSAALSPDSPEFFLPLAERRGKKLPAQLRCEPLHLRNPYPGIPTPFLGTPSAYSPKFELSSNKRTSMNLQDMISSLRHQGTVLHDKSDSLVIEEEPLVNHLPLPLTPTTPASALADDDDWAFADGLLDRYPDSSIVAAPVTHAKLQHEESAEITTTDITDTDDLLSRLDDNAGGELCPEPRPCDLPFSPSVATSISPPRSILKRCKNVRFASLPKDKRLSMFPSIPPPSAIIISQPQAHAVSNTSEAPRPSLEAAGRQRPERSVLPRPLSLAPPAPAFVQKTSRTSPRKPFRKAGSPPIISRPIPQSHIKPRGRHSLGGMVKESAGKENKEQKGRASFSPKAVSRLTLDENTFRRGNTNSNGSPKSRMPVPLRNILTRFK